MVVKQAASKPVFGKRKEPHTVIIARGNEVRHFTIRPWLAAVAGSMVAAAAIGYLSATTYLVLRDDLISGSVARQARIQQGYEDRISALRTQVDRITSRQLLDQQLMENKVAELLERQKALTNRHGRLGPLLERAGQNGLKADMPVPQPRPEERADAASPSGKTGRIKTASALPGALAFWNGTTGSVAETAADRADRLFVGINKSLRSIEKEQVQGLAELTREAQSASDQIATALDEAGLKGVKEGEDKVGVGGPLVPANASSAFDFQVAELDGALERLDALKGVVRRYPLANPLPGQPISSRFGYRKDPILGTTALHAGMDFRAPVGMPIRSTGDGVVITAGWNGGYGRMVEVKHADGYTSRYAHMSQILVNVGDKVSRGSIVGKSGNSGRSTGPHLHYEVRKEGKAANPLRYLTSGRKISGVL
ncbi:MAG: M23 family metallopeptidase [Notoacmeibacter sp.]|nr:M23 family metallopeptidase [Notoacmeibacter sp.]MCC0031773.1 M23 family metallopeptidase [Brucellaceae bacterium]